MPTFTPAQLELVARDVLLAAGVRDADAHLVADLLVDANLVGHDSHGIIRIPQYLIAIDNGEVDLTSDVEVVRDTPIASVLEANRGFGQAVMMKAVAIAREKATAVGMAAVAVRHATHIGRVGVYAERLARDGLVALLFVNASGIPAYRMAPWGGTEARLATDPMAQGIPTRSEPVVIDMTTTVVAEGKVRVKHNSNQPAPDGWLLDPDGQPTSDAGVIYREPRGSIMPLGGTTAGHKGYGLNVAIELLGGALTGSGCVQTQEALTNGVLLIALDIGQLCDLDEFYTESERFIAHVRSSPPQDGVEAVLLPGEIEHRTRQARQAAGIEVDEGTWQQVAECAAKLGVATP